MTASDFSDSLEEIAIIGMAGRFPGARNLAEFWENLKGGVESIRFFTPEELAREGVAPHLLGNPSYVRANAVVDDIELFDADFFGFTPREAEFTDPQQRLFLECVWEALENAGYDTERFQGSIGLYAGVSLNTYLISNLLSNRRLIEKFGFLQTSILNRTDHLTTHAAYKLNLRGPTVTVQTTCSTSLVAVHLACQSLLGYQSDIALAGGVTITIPDKAGYLYQEGGINSPDGHCRAFDAGANGTVSGNGAGVVVLKRLEEALADGDHIRAVIRSTAINNDGSEKIGYTTPSVSGQAQVIALAQAMAGVSPEQLSYIEAHGTGTPLGDPIEVEALTQVFRRSTRRKTFCGIGSVKTNIGHLDTAAGIAGLIKTTLALEHRQIPPSLHFAEPNPRINFADSPFYVNAALRPWESDGGPRTAGVSSFGIGGTNAHVIIGEAPATARAGSKRPRHLLVLSARTGTALEALTANLRDYLEQHPEADLGDLAYTLQVGRRAFSHRRSVICGDREGALSALGMTDISKVVTGSKEAFARPVAFMFSGQGSQYVNMCSGLYGSEPAFRRHLDRCAELLGPHLGARLQDVLFPPEGQAGQAAERLKQTAFAQPALFAVEYALAQLLMEWGIEPEAMIGHSVGEYVAACLAGVLSLEDALRLVAGRGRLMQQLPGGSMLSVQLPEGELRSRMPDGLEIAAINSPSLCVVSGADEAVGLFESELSEAGVVCRRLHTSHAFHSSMMEPILDDFLRLVKTVRLNRPQRPFVSNLTGEWITDAEATSPEYWTKHLRRAVQFSKGLRKLFQDPAWILLEVGPGRALMTMARWHPQKPTGQMVLTSLPTAESGRADDESVLMALGQLWVAGVEPRWESLHKDDPRGRLPLPTYPFERQRFWVDAKPEAASSAEESLEKDPDRTRWFYAPVWKHSAQGEAKAAGPQDKGETAWLFFAGRAGLGREMAGRLRESSEKVVAVAHGEAFAKLGPLDYSLDAARPEQYVRLFEELARDGLTPNRVVYSWSVNRAAEPDAESAPGAGASPDYRSLIYLAQALGTCAPGRAVHLDILTLNLYEVTGGEAVVPESALLVGPCKVIPQEYEGVTCRLIDIDSDGEAVKGGAQFVESLLEELSEPSEETVAYRHGRRWVQLFERVRLEEPAQAPPRLRQGGVYLITGGLGGVGLAIAEYLAREAGARLVLTGRSSLPPREQWDEWLRTHDPEARDSRRIRSLLALSAAGAEVAYFAADVSDPAGMAEVWGQAVARFGPIHGVVHAAGVAGGELIQLKKEGDAGEVLAPKVGGTRVLRGLLRGHEPDFFILCSSRSALLGGFGGVDYCAANAFLDAFAHRYRQETGSFAVSINWPAWQEVGMLAETAAAYHARGAARGEAGPSFGHPLIDGHVAEGLSRHVFHSRFQVNTHWILDEHRILGTAVVPGVAYLEMARAAFQQAVSRGPVELSDVYFFTPLSMKDDEASDVRLVLERDGDGYDFYVDSAPTDGASQDSNRHRHVIGKIAALASAPTRKVDVGQLIGRCRRRDILLTEDDFFDEDLGPRWQSMKRVYLGDNELVALTELPDEYAGELADFGLYPALMDRAAGYGIMFLVERESGYLPFSYQRLRVHGALPKRLYVHATGREDADPNKETTSFDIQILAEDGTVLVEVEGFSHKRIKEVAKGVKALAAGNQSGGEWLREMAEGAAGSGDAFDARQSLYEQAMSRGVSTAEGVWAFAAVLGSKALPQVVVSPNSLQAVINQARQMRAGNYEEKAESLPVISSVHKRPDVQTPYVPPTGGLETQLAAVWQEMLGINRVGIHDNFFDLGGDSVLAIQVMANARKAGLNFTVQQLFQHPTIAQLAALAGGAQAAPSAESGELPLLPAQNQFFGGGGASPHGWSLLLEVEAGLDAKLLEEGLSRVLASHESLRLRFPGASAGRAARVAPASAVPLHVIDLRRLAPEERLPNVVETARQFREQFDVDEGPLMKFALFERGATEKPLLLVVSHQLVADMPSARVLLRDLQSEISARRGAERGPAASDARRYREVADGVFQFAQSPAVSSEAAYWLDMRRREFPSLPAGRQGEGPSAPGGPALHRTQLGAGDTHALLSQALRAYHTRVEDFLLAALVKVFCRWSGAESLWLDYRCRIEGVPGLGLSNAVGPFTSTAPVVLDLPPADADGQGALLTSIKEQVRSIPRGGSSYAMARYHNADPALREGLEMLPRPQVSFDYLGELDSLLPEGSLFSLHPVAPVAEVEEPESSGYALAVRSFVHEGRLTIYWFYDRALLDDETLRGLADAHASEVLALVGHCAAKDSESFTPADFPLADLDSRKLNKVARLLEKADKTAAR